GVPAAGAAGRVATGAGAGPGGAATEGRPGRRRDATRTATAPIAAPPIAASTAASTCPAPPASRSFQVARRLPVGGAGRAVAPGDPAGDHVPDALTDVDGVVADALVGTGDHGELHGDLQVDVPVGVALEDRLGELLLEHVEVVVHVGEGGGAHGVVV